MKFDSNTITIKHENNLLLGWATGKIGDLIGEFGLFCDGDWVESKDQNPNGSVRLIQLADIGDGYYRNKSYRFLTEEKADGLNCTFLKPGDLLIARLGEPLGKSCIFPGDEKISVTAVDVCIVRAGKSNTFHKWLMYSINSTLFRKAIGSLQSGTTRKRISRKNLAKITFPIPPLQEQQRIVAKIEELFTKLDAGVEALKQAQAQLKRYRQSVLKAAVEGRLTAEWREQHKDELEPADKLLERIQEERKAKLGKKYKDLMPVDTSNLPELPEGWEWNRFDWFVDVSQNGFGKRKSNESRKAVVLRLADIQNGEISYNSVRRIGTSKKEIESYKLENNDLLCTRVNGSSELVGRMTLFKQGVEPILFCDHIIRFRLSEYENVSFIRYFFDTEIVRSYIKQNMVSSAGQNTVSQGTIKNMPIPVFCKNEKNHLTNELDRIMSVIYEYGLVIESELKRAQSLRQSILKRAFEGKLVPQDPNDEPASVLLDRIKEEKAKSKKSKQMEKF